MSGTYHGPEDPDDPIIHDPGAGFGPGIGSPGSRARPHGGPTTEGADSSFIKDKAAASPRAPRGGEEPTKPRAPKKKGRRWIPLKVKIVAVVLIIALGFGYFKVPMVHDGIDKAGASLIDKIKGEKPEEAQAKPAPAPKPAAGNDCKKWAPPSGVTADIMQEKLDLNRAAVRTAVNTPLVVVGTSRLAPAPSAVVVVGCGPHVITKTVAGEVDGAEPSTSTTLYDVASVTKSLEYVGVMQLVAEGKLNLDDPVGDYLPAWSEGEKSEVTVKMLLNHTSGMLGEDSKDLSKEYAPAINGLDDPVAIEQRVVGMDLAYTPGEFHYSNLGYMVLYQVAGKAAGGQYVGQFNRYLRDRLFVPLGMKNTVFKPDSKSRQCAPTRQFDGGKATPECQVRDTLAYETGGVQGHAGLFTTADDMAKFAAMLAGGGAVGKKRFISADAVKQMGVAHSGSSYGIGAWTNSTGRWGGQLGKTAFGGYGDTGAAFSIDPVTGYWVVFLNNSSPTKGRLGEKKAQAIKGAIKKVNDFAIKAAKTAR